MTSLKDFVYKIDKPFVFKKEVSINCAPEWTLQSLVQVFGDEKFQFRIGRKQNHGNVQFENECDYIEATVSQFMTWLASTQGEKRPKISTPFDPYAPKDYWAYADYKYMIELIEKNKSLENVSSNR
jgi:HSPB1-associated protein 1